MTNLLGSSSVHLAGRFSAQGAVGGTQSQQNARCQRCLQVGHWTYQCKNEPAYAARPSRTQQLKQPKARPRFLSPDELPPEFRPREDAEKPRKEGEGRGHKGADRRKRRRRSSPSSSSSSSSSDDSSSSGTSSDETSSDSSSDSDSSRSSGSTTSSGTSSDSSTSSGSSGDTSGSSGSSSGDSSDTDSGSSGGGRKRRSRKRDRKR